MKKDLTDLITIDSDLAVPVYKQIVQSISRGIDDGHLKQNDKLPSVNSIAEKFSLARGSVFTAYNDLRASGIIDSVPGKGYFITSTQTKLTQKILLLFDAFNAQNAELYNSILQHLPAGNKVDLHFHQHDKIAYERLIREESSYYNSFVIMPEIYEENLSALSAHEVKQVLLIGNGYKELRKNFAGVYQNAEKDLYSTLSNHKTLAKKYKRLFLVVPSGTSNKEIVAGFKKFSKTDVIRTAVIENIELENVKKGDAFVVIDDQQLTELLTCADQGGLLPGKDIGVLSYNESALKSLVANGISTITPDYIAMGKSIAEMLSTGNRQAVENPLIMTDRNSF